MRSSLLLVAKLRDGNERVQANDLVVDQLVTLGAAAIPPLRAAIGDLAFPGRGYSAWALALVLEASEESDADYVRLLAKSGLRQLEGG